MLRHYNIQKDPIRKAHLVGSSVVLTLDPTHVRRLQIDDSTFFVEKPVEDGILLHICRLDFGSKKEDEDESGKVEGPAPDVKNQSS